MEIRCQTTAVDDTDARAITNEDARILQLRSVLSYGRLMALIKVAVLCQNRLQSIPVLDT